jgi:hypothetical protein
MIAVATDYSDNHYNHLMGRYTVGDNDSPTISFSSFTNGYFGPSPSGYQRAVLQIPTKWRREFSCYLSDEDYEELTQWCKDGSIVFPELRERPPVCFVTTKKLLRPVTALSLRQKYQNKRKGWLHS